MTSLWSGWGSDPFAEQVEKATSELLPAGQEDIALNLDICDQVRAKQVQPKHAMQVIKRRVGHKNPNVVLLALGLTDICIKNGGDSFLQEVTSREFMDNLVSVIKNPTGVNPDVKSKALGLIQNWAQIAEAKPNQMSYILDVYKTLKGERLEFPPRDPHVVASAALVETMTAPEWVDGDVCMRCRTAFTTFNRKHHCRNCANVFCQQCSSHTMSLPWFGIGQDVRVCDGCFARKGPAKNSAAKLSRSKSASSTPTTTNITASARGASSHHRSATLSSKPKKSYKEDHDLALAIKLSLESAPNSGMPTSSGFQAPSQPSLPSTNHTGGRMLEGTDADDDPDLAAAIAASLRVWAPPQPSAPDVLVQQSTSSQAAPFTTGASAVPPQNSNDHLPLPPSLELPCSDVDSILTFVQTIKAQQTLNQRNGVVGAPPHQQAQALYEKATSSRPQMARSLDEAKRRHTVLASMHDKLTEAVRLYDRLLDAQISRPGQLAPLQTSASAAIYPPHVGYDYDSRAYYATPQPSQPQPPPTYHQPTGPSVYPSVPTGQPAYHVLPSDHAVYAYSSSSSSVPLGSYHHQQQEQHQPPLSLQHQPSLSLQHQLPPQQQQPQPAQMSPGTQQRVIAASSPMPYSDHGYQHSQYNGGLNTMDPSVIGAATGLYSPSGAIYAGATFAQQQPLPDGYSHNVSSYGQVNPPSNLTQSPISLQDQHLHQQQPHPALPQQQQQLADESVNLNGYHHSLTGAAQSNSGLGQSHVNDSNAAVLPSREHQTEQPKPADTTVSSHNGWSTSPIQSTGVAAGLDGTDRTLYQQNQQPQSQSQPQIGVRQVQVQPTGGSTGVATTNTLSSHSQQHYPKLDNTSHLPLFPIAPHPDNGFGASSAQTHSALQAHSVSANTNQLPAESLLIQL